jgi:3-hydroxybutyryl-CoA dehydrogenase
MIQFTTPLSIRLGVVGAGTMGSGIALTALLADMYVTLYDIDLQTLERAWNSIDRHLARKSRSSNLTHLKLTSEWEDLGKANFIIEAVPEDLAIKQDLFSRLDALCPPPVILATNTSTLAVTAIAAATQYPERVVGMHFFNPAPVLPLVEVVRAAQTDDAAVQAAVAAAKFLGKTPVEVRDTPGFIVNRVARPFYGEALRLAGEGAASYEVIDRVVRLGGGFKMGPFQLMDLIGIDVNLAATQSMYEQTYGEPRYRPHYLQVQMTQQKALGRKTGRGFYNYDSEPPFDDSLRLPAGLGAAKGPGEQAVYLAAGDWAPGMAQACRQAGYLLAAAPGAGYLALSPTSDSVGLVAVGYSEGLKERLASLERQLPSEALILCQCADVTLTELAAEMNTPERLVGFDGLFFAGGQVATLVASPVLTDRARRAAETFIASLGRLPIWVNDSPGLILPRVVCMLANEAAFAAGEGIAEPEEIDRAMQLGVNYPKGPLAWARQLGLARVVAVLDHLHAELGEERYRVAPLLRRWARLEKLTGY